MEVAKALEPVPRECERHEGAPERQRVQGWPVLREARHISAYLEAVLSSCCSGLGWGMHTHAHASEVSQRAEACYL